MQFQLQGQVKRVASLWDNLSQTIHNKKRNSFQTLQRQADNVESSAFKLVQLENCKFAELHQFVASIRQQHQKLAPIHRTYDSKHNQIISLQDQFKLQIQSFKQKSSGVVQTLRLSGQEQLPFLQQIKTSQRQFQDNLKQANKKLAELQRQIRSQQSKRQQLSLSISKQIKQQTDKTQQQLKHQQCQHQANHKKINSLLSEIKSKLDSSIHHERAKRKDSHQNMLILIERVCGRMSEHFSK